MSFSDYLKYKNNKKMSIDVSYLDTDPFWATLNKKIQKCEIEQENKQLPALRPKTGSVAGSDKESPITETKESLKVEDKLLAKQGNEVSEMNSISESLKEQLKPFKSAKRSTFLSAKKKQMTSFEDNNFDEDFKEGKEGQEEQEEDVKMETQQKLQYRMRRTGIKLSEIQEIKEMDRYFRRKALSEQTSFDASSYDKQISR